MKKFLANLVLLLIVLSIFLSGCGTKPAISDNTAEPTPSNSTSDSSTTSGESTGTPSPTGTQQTSTPTISAGTSTPSTTVEKTDSTPTKKPDPTKEPTKKPTPTPTPTPKPTSKPAIKPVSIAWPKGQALPHFSKPATTLDTISVANLSQDEQITFSALQGLVNKRQPRIYLVDPGADEGTYTWANTSTVNLTSRKTYSSSKKYDLVKKYAHELKGVVLYSTSKSPHYRNLAGTIAGLKDAIPVTQTVYNNLKKNGIELKVLVDLTKLTYNTPVQIYNYLYNNYWDDCDKRVLLSAKPYDNGDYHHTRDIQTLTFLSPYTSRPTDYHHTRDIQTAVGSAVVYLDCMNSSEKAVYEKFLKGMKAGEAIVLGWYTSERSGVTTATKYGIGTVPADLYISGSVYSGQSHDIKIPKAPAKPELKNKVYVAMYISDGDNIQYNQRYMRKLWDESKNIRGKVNLNRTISPALVDIGPQLLNYYYTTATTKDCFVTGPSGLGYLMPVNTLPETGADTGEHIKIADKAKLDAYAKLTNTYLKKAGIRVITVWDSLSDWQRKSYADNMPNLLGATVQHFTNGTYPKVESSYINGKLFEKLKEPYYSTGDMNWLYYSIAEEIENWNGRSPLFLSYQVVPWFDDKNPTLKTQMILDIYNELNRNYKGDFEFVRADHYFELYNENEARK